VTSILHKALSKSMPGAKSGGRPPAAVELSPEGVLAAALPGSGEPPAYAFVPLPPGALIPGIGEPNIRAAEAVSAASRSALNLVSPRTRSVTLILPDTAVRVFMLDFDSLPARAVEAIPVLRFRLRKMVPFDVEHAGISYQVLSQNKNEWKVLTAVLPGPILAEYEAAVRAAGYEPGSVLPSSLAALEAVDSMEAVLAANLSPIALTTSIANGSDLLLHRTLDLPENPALRLAEIQRGIAVAAAYFEDKLQAPARAVHYAGSYQAADFASWIDNPDLTVVDLAPRPETGATTALGNANIAGAAGALAGAN
jgi:type IV pilus assembly protein PilM